MKIAVNTRLLISNKLDGIGWYTFETIKRIVTKHQECTFYFLFDRPYSDEFIFSDNIIPVVVPPPARHPVLWYIWLEFSIHFQLKKINPDIFISPDGFIPLNLTFPSITVIHDINFHHRPKDLPYLTRKYYQNFFPKFAQKATRIATVSNYSKNDICKSYGINPDKIDVTYNGANTLYTPLNDVEKVKTKDIFTNGANYFIFIGTLHPRKNIEGLLLAFDKYRGKSSELMKLVIVGEKMFMTGGIKKVFSKMRYADDVVFTGRLDPDELRMVLGAAAALVFVPFFEGFGIPMVEAMYCDVPVIASDVTSMPEIAGNAAIYADPYSIESIATSMYRVINEPGLANSLIDNAREQRKKYTWDHTAESLWESINKCT